MNNALLTSLHTERNSEKGPSFYWWKNLLTALHTVSDLLLGLQFVCLCRFRKVVWIAEKSTKEIAVLRIRWETKFFPFKCLCGCWLLQVCTLQQSMVSESEPKHWEIYWTFPVSIDLAALHSKMCDCPVREKDETSLQSHWQKIFWVCQENYIQQKTKQAVWMYFVCAKQEFLFAVSNFYTRYIQQRMKQMTWNLLGQTKLTQRITNNLNFAWWALLFRKF